MKRCCSLLLVATATLTPALAQEDTATGKAATITILTTEAYGTSACRAFAAKSIMNGVSQATSLTGTGTGAGKIDFSPLTLAKHVDDCSPTLFLSAAQGALFSEVIAVVEGPKSSTGVEITPIFLIRLGRAAIQNLSDSATDGKAVLETVTFDYADLSIAQYDPKTREFTCNGWNRQTNARDTSTCTELRTVAEDRANGKSR